jgi:hypothetical protein
MLKSYDELASTTISHLWKVTPLLPSLNVRDFVI